MKRNRKSKSHMFDSSSSSSEFEHEYSSSSSDTELSNSENKHGYKRKKLFHFENGAVFAPSGEVENLIISLNFRKPLHCWLVLESPDHCGGIQSNLRWSFHKHNLV